MAIVLNQTLLLQLMVEHYFLATAVLSTYYYWLGARRMPDLPPSLVFVPFANMTGGDLPMTYSATAPYAHWASYHYRQAVAPG